MYRSEKKFCFHGKHKDRNIILFFALSDKSTHTSLHCSSEMIALQMFTIILIKTARFAGMLFFRNYGYNTAGGKVNP